jgi:hypothetical protein
MKISCKKKGLISLLNADLMKQRKVNIPDQMMSQCAKNKEAQLDGQDMGLKQRYKTEKWFNSCPIGTEDPLYERG